MNNPETKPQQNPTKTVQISQAEFDFLFKMQQDMGFLAHSVNEVVKTFWEALPAKKRKEIEEGFVDAANGKTPDFKLNIFEMAPIAQKMMPKMAPMTEGLLPHLPRLKQVCEKYSVMHKIRKDE